MQTSLSPSLFTRLDQWLLKPVVPVTPIEARTARLTTAVALFASLFTLVPILIYHAPFYFWIAFLLGASAYWLSRRDGQQIAAVIIIIFLTFPSFLGLFSNDVNAETGILSPVVLLPLPLLLASALLPPRGVLLYALGCVGGLLLVPMVTPELTMGMVMPSIGFVITMSALLLVVMWHRNFLETLRQAELREANEKLRESEANLEQRVIDRTRELDAALIEADHANKAKSQFLAAMSHELRTPLNAIINLSLFAGQGMLGEVNAEQVDAMQKVNSSGKHLLALINDVLDISKIESGSLQLLVEDKVDVCEELTSLKSTALTLLEGKPVEVILDCEHVPSIRADRLRLRQIVLNLISNACKFTDTGSVKIHAQREGENILIAVTDSGPGIDPKDFESIFETFHQTEVGLRKGKGTGLGLPISRRLAEAHFGRLWVESELGKGATFYVSLPIKSERLEVTLQST